MDDITEQNGEGIKEVAEAVYKKGKDILAAIKGVRTKASPSIRKFLETNGNAKITKIVVSRKPIISAIDKIANWVSGGKWDENKQKLNYDNVFHLFMNVTLDNGKTFQLEKNQVPKINSVSAQAPKQENVNASTPKVTLAQFFANGERKAGSPEKFWVYDSITQNCQYFMKWLLQGSNVWSSSLDKFVMQNTEKLIEGLSWFKNVARKVTDIANKADIIIEGEGKKQCGGGANNENNELWGRLHIIS